MTPALLLAAMTVATPPGAQTAPQCFPTVAEMAEYLDAWGERQAFSGVSDEGTATLIVFIGEHSWSLVASLSVTTCVIDQGRDWKFHNVGGPL